MDTGILFTCIGIFCLLIWSAFFSGSETALTSISKAKLHKMSKDGHKGAKRVKNLVEKPETLLSTILLGNNLVNIAASALTTGLFIQLFGDIGVAYATLVLTVIVLIFAEVLPKTMANKYPEKISIIVATPMRWLMLIFKPATWLIRKISRGIMRILRINPNNTEQFSQHDVRGAIGLGLDHGVLEHGEHRMLDSILDMDMLTVYDIMIHRSAIESVDATMNPDKLAKIVGKSRHSRIPVWESEADNIIGIFHIKDFYSARQNAFETKKPFVLKNILQPPYFIPETTSIATQLLEFRRQRRHLSLVVDEYGVLLGLVTLEDILEEIVGEIEDEHDAVRIDIQKEKNGVTVVSGHVPVRDLNRKMNWDLPDDEAVTVAGLIFDELDRIPAIGETLEIAGLQLRVTAKKRQTITKISIKKLRKNSH